MYLFVQTCFSYLTSVAYSFYSLITSYSNDLITYLFLTVVDLD